MAKKRIPKKVQERVRLVECEKRVREIVQEYPELSVLFALSNGQATAHGFSGHGITLLGLGQMVLFEIAAEAEER